VFKFRHPSLDLHFLGLLVLLFLLFRLHGLFEELLVVCHALAADVKEALAAVVEFVVVLAAELAGPASLELGETQLVLVVTGAQLNGPALEAVALEPRLSPQLLLAVVATQLDDLLLVAAAAHVDGILRTVEVAQHVIQLALGNLAPLLVSRGPLVLQEALGAQSGPALLVEVVLLALPQTAHAAILILQLLVLAVIAQVEQHQLMFVLAAGIVVLDLHHLALQTVELEAPFALLGALPLPETQGAVVQLVNTVDLAEGGSAGTLGGDVGDKLPGLGGIEVLRQGLVAGPAYSEVAGGVIVDAVVADGGANPAEVADVVEVGDVLVAELVADGTPFLGAGRHSAVHAVELIADAADRTAQLDLLATHTAGFQHRLVGPQVELQLVPLQAPVLCLQPAAVDFLGGDKGAEGVVQVEVAEAADGDTALAGVVRAVEVKHDVVDWLDQEGTAAAKRALVVGLPPVRDTPHAVNPFAAPPALHWLHTHLEAHCALVSLP
jgi:hypothetical protein